MSWRVHHGDWFETLCQVDHATAQLMLIDPPYNLTALDYEQPINWRDFFSEAWWRMTAAGVIAVFCQQPFTSVLMGHVRRQFVCERIWCKTRKTGGLNSKHRPLQQHEGLLVLSRMPRQAIYHPLLGTGPVKGLVNRGATAGHSKHYGTQKVHSSYIGTDRQPTTLMHYASVKRVRGLTHPSEKPVDMLTELVTTYTEPGGLVIDPFCGRASVGEAAIRSGRSYVGGDKDPHWVDKSRERLHAVSIEMGAGL